MLTRADVTVPDAVEIYEREVRQTGVRWVGFKDVGPDIGVLERLAASIRADGRTAVLEVVSVDEEAELRSVRTGIQIGVDVIMGGTRPVPAAALIAPTPIAYFPFPGTVVGHPSVLEGTIDDIVGSAVAISASPDVHGLDLLAYRSRGDAARLVRSVVEAVSCPVVVAGSIDSPSRIREGIDAGAPGFTIGSAILDGTFAPGIGVRASIERVLDIVADARRSPGVPAA